MNKTQLIKKAKVLLSEYEALQKEQRNYENENWHCVNVKRRSDYVDIDKLLKEMKVKKKYQEEIKDSIMDGEYISQDLYYNWLDQCWEQLEYEMRDIEAITKGSKDERKEFQYIKLQGEIRKEDYKTRCNTCYINTHYETEQKCKVDKCAGTLKKITHKQEYDNRKYIYALGRSGGWACFQDTLGEYVYDELQAIIDWEDNCFMVLECAEDKINEVKQAIEEINYIKNYINRFNKSLDFKEEIKYRIGEKIMELEEEEKSIQTDTNRFKDDIKQMATQMQVRVEEYEKDKTLKASIQRHLTGIIKLTK